MKYQDLKGTAANVTDLRLIRIPINESETGDIVRHSMGEKPDLCFEHNQENATSLLALAV